MIRPQRIRLAQLYTGGVGAEIVRRCVGHPQFELVAVLVHSDDKTGRDSGTLVGGEPNGIVTTQRIDDVLAARPDAVVYSGMQWDVDLFARLLRGSERLHRSRRVLPPGFARVRAARRRGSCGERRRSPRVATSPG